MTNITTRPNITWTIALILVSAVSAFHMLATWDWDGRLSQVNAALRHFSLPVVWIELMLLLWAARCGWDPIRHFTHLPRLAKQLFMLLIFSVMITSIFSSNLPATSALLAVRFIIHIAVLSSLIFLISNDEKFDFEFWANGLVLGAASYLFLLIIFCILVTDPVNFRWVIQVPSATNIRQISNILGILALVPTTLLMFEKYRRRQFFLVLLLIAILTFIMWTGTRTALFGYLTGFCIALIVQPSYFKWDRFFGILVAIILALVISLFLPIPDPQFGIIRIAESISAQDISTGRVKLWLDALNAIMESPLLGHGAGTYRLNMHFGNPYPVNHPHNFVIQFIYDWGVLGGGIALIFLGWLGYRIAYPKGHEEKFLAVCAYGGLLATAFVEGTLFHPLPIVIAFAMIAPWLSARPSAGSQLLQHNGSFKSVED